MYVPINYNYIKGYSEQATDKKCSQLKSDATPNQTPHFTPWPYPSVLHVHAKG